MVRGKVSRTKNSTNKKSATTAPGDKAAAASSKLGTPSTSTKLPAKSRSSSSIPACSECGIVITDDVRALQCDRCESAESWKCASCLNLTVDVYDQLVVDNGSNLRWFCESCDRAITDSSAQPVHSGKIDKLFGLIERVLEKYEILEKVIDGKCDSNSVYQLDARVSMLEDRVQSWERGIESRVAALESSATSCMADGCDDAIMAAVSMEEVTKQVREEIAKKAEEVWEAEEEKRKRKTDEERDIESRKNNIIIYRIPEKKNNDISARRTSDEVFLKDLLDGVFDMKVGNGDIVKMYRLGRWEEDKIRPLLVSFKSCEQKDYIMENLRNLKTPIEKFRGISISHDLHPKEREERKQMIQQAKQDHMNNSSERVENYKFLVVGRGQRCKVIKVKRNATPTQPQPLTDQ